MDPKYVITLVHGTFAHDATWVDSASEFSKLLSEQIIGFQPSKQASEILRIETLRWSGHNSHEERVKGGDLLASHLLDMHYRYPGSEQIIIAHSHGGNVAMYAIKQLGTPNFKFRIITMATPFLNASVRPTENRVKMVSSAARMVAAPALFLVYAVLGLLLFVSLHALFPERISDTAYNILLFILLILGTRSISKSSKNAEKKVQEDQHKFFAGGSEILSKFDISGYNGYKSMSVVFNGDEARILLKTSQFLGNLPLDVSSFINSLLLPVIKRRWTLFWAWIAGSMVASFYDMSLQKHTIKGVTSTPYIDAYITYSILIGTWVICFCSLSVPIVYAISLIVKSQPLAFGWESMVHVFTLGVEVSPVPKHLPNNYYKPYTAHFSRFEKRNMRHSMVYATPEIINDIAQWIITE